MATTTKFIIGSDLTVTVTGVENAAGDLLDGASTLTGQLLDDQDDEVAMMTFDYSGTPGEFSGTLSTPADMKANRAYKLMVTVVAPGPEQFLVEIPRLAQHARL